MFAMKKENFNRFILAHAHYFVENYCMTIVNTLMLLLFYSSSSYYIANDAGLKHVLENCRILKQMQLKIFIDVEIFYKHAVELIAQTYNAINMQESKTVQTFDDNLIDLIYTH